MKKTAIMLVLLTALLFSVFTAASAVDEKEQYYLDISCALNNIDYNLQHEEPAEAEVWMKALRLKVYEAAKYLAANKIYDARLLQVISLVQKAFANQDDLELVIEYIALARNNASIVLLGQIEDYISDACDFNGDLNYIDKPVEETSNHS